MCGPRIGFLDKYKADRHVKETLKPLQIENFGDWRDSVRKWWNDWVAEGWFHKRKQLFLWGALFIEAKDTRMDIDALNAFRVSVGTKPSPQQSDRRKIASTGK